LVLLLLQLPLPVEILLVTGPAVLIRSIVEAEALWNPVENPFSSKTWNGNLVKTITGEVSFR
jgi:hypothetical protein